MEIRSMCTLIGQKRCLRSLDAGARAFDIYCNFMAISDHLQAYYTKPSRDANPQPYRFKPSFWTT